MDLKEVQESIGAAAFMGIGAVAKHVFDWFAGKRQTTALARKTDAEADVAISSAWKTLIDELRHEMAARDAECDRRLERVETAIRNDLGHQIKNLTSLIYSLAKKQPLDTRQKQILAEIAPEPAGE